MERKRANKLLCALHKKWKRVWGTKSLQVLNNVRTAHSKLYEVHTNTVVKKEIPYQQETWNETWDFVLKCKLLN